ncbi:hypothetical protein SDC9_106097 [bioreactor metagenome]|uniref:Uncharacterized protein n=1 Tax=bioreactor metagenome TaxID=1076179 RepID=A0A645B1H0_9ZZZZ
MLVRPIALVKQHNHLLTLPFNHRCKPGYPLFEIFRAFGIKQQKYNAGTSYFLVTPFDTNHLYGLLGIPYPGSIDETKANTI